MKVSEWATLGGTVAAIAWLGFIIGYLRGEDSANKIHAQYHKKNDRMVA